MQKTQIQVLNVKCDVEEDGNVCTEGILWSAERKQKHLKILITQ